MILAHNLLCFSMTITSRILQVNNTFKTVWSSVCKQLVYNCNMIMDVYTLLRLLIESVIYIT